VIDRVFTTQEKKKGRKAKSFSKLMMLLFFLLSFLVWQNPD